MTRLWWKVSFAIVALSGCAPAAAGEGSPSTPPPPDAASAGAAAPPAFAAMLTAHDELRAKHCAPPLAWSDELARAAQAWADKLAKKGCSLEHSKTPFGENLAAGTLASLGPADVVGLWYAERAQYDFARGAFSMKTGHFTQLVWVGTRRVGCGNAKCADKEVWVCNYDPPGNVEGQFKQNVLPTTCKR